MDTKQPKQQFVVLDYQNQVVGSPSNSIETAFANIKNAVSSQANKKRSPFFIFVSIEKVEVERIAINLVRTPIQLLPAPEPGYQPEGFEAQQSNGQLKSDPEWDRTFVRDTVNGG